MPVLIITNNYTFGLCKVYNLMQEAFCIAYTQINDVFVVKVFD